MSDWDPNRGELRPLSRRIADLEAGAFFGFLFLTVTAAVAGGLFVFFWLLAHLLSTTPTL